MANNITIELCQEDRKRIDELIGFAALIATAMNSKGATGSAPAAAMAEPDKAPVEVALHPEPDQEPFGEVKITLEMIRSKVMSLMTGGDASKKADIRKLIMKYAPNVTALPEESWRDVWDGLEKISGGAANG